MKKILILLLIWSLPLLCIEGFDPQTLIVTPRLYSLVPIGTLKIADVIASPQPGYINSYSSVKQILRLPSSTIVQITINTVVITCGPDQLFYSPTHQQWTKASDLSTGDLLLTIDNKFVAITAIQTLNTPTILAALSCYAPHTFAVTQYGIVVHNVAPIAAGLILVAPGSLGVGMSAAASSFFYCVSTGAALAGATYTLGRAVSEFFGHSSKKKIKECAVANSGSCGTSTIDNNPDPLSCGHDYGSLTPPDVYRLCHRENPGVPLQSICPPPSTAQHNHKNQCLPQLKTPLSDTELFEDYEDDFDNSSTTLNHIAHQCAKNKDTKKPKQTAEQKRDKKQSEIPKTTPKPGPYGLYEGVRYHKDYDTPFKSRRPKNGQAALDNSVLIKETSPARIGISCGEFVVLEFSSEGLYHGHVRQWKKLHPDMQEALIRRGMATRQGRIIEDA